MKLEELELGGKKMVSIIPITVGALISFASVVFWTLNTIFPILSANHAGHSGEHVTPGRWFMSFLAPIVFTTYGFRRKSLNVSGALLALIVGFFLTISSYCFFMCLMVFFLTSSRATKFRANLKKKFEEGFKEGGQRNWIQVICNGGMALNLSILYLVDVGYGERPIDFGKDYRASWLGIGILGALATANGDTWASEIGSVITTTAPRLITTFRKVPTGTNGGVTLGGVLVSALGGLAVGLGYYLVILFMVDSAILLRSPPQWPLLIVGATGGLLGSLLDSLIGATLQYSGKDGKGKIYETPGKGIRHISGVGIFDNHSVNLISTILTGLLLPSISMLIWNLFR